MSTNPDIGASLGDVDTRELTTKPLVLGKLDKTEVISPNGQILKGLLLNMYSQDPNGVGVYLLGRGEDNQMSTFGLFFNPAALRMLPGEVQPPAKYSDLTPDDQLAGFAPEFREEVLGRIKELINPGRPGERLFDVGSNFTEYFDDGEKTTQVQVVLSEDGTFFRLILNDVTEGHIDGLTKLPLADTFRRIMRTYQGRIEQEDRDDRGRGSRKKSRVKFGILYADVDDLKGVNDSRGHPVGDKLIAKAGLIFREAFNRKEEDPARVGGDEFALVIPECDELEAANIPDRIKAIEQSVNLRTGGLGTPDVRLSIGVVSRDSEMFNMERREDFSVSVETMRSVADKLMYMDKFTNKLADQVKQLKEAGKTLAQIRAELLDAIIKGQLTGVKGSKGTLTPEECEARDGLLMPAYQRFFGEGYSEQDRQLELVAFASHEVGSDKMIKQKESDKLSREEEFENYRHPIYARIFLEKLAAKTGDLGNITDESGNISNIYQDAAKVVALHHEYENNTGYPFPMGPGGEWGESPYESKLKYTAQLLALNDEFVSLTTRAYKRAFPLSSIEALKEIEKNYNQRFNKALIASFSESLLGVLGNTAHASIQDI